LEERTLLSPGDLDPTFGIGGLVTTTFPGFPAVPAQSLAIQPDGHIVVAGFTSNGGTPDSRFALARYNSDGSLDTSFGTAGLVDTAFPGVATASAYGLALQADGSIVVVGSASSNLRNYQFAVARYNSDGSLDTSFGTGGLVTTVFPGFSNAYAYSVAVQADGHIVVVGGASTAFTEGFALARYNSDGSLDSSFGTGGLVTTAFPDISFAYARTVTAQPDGSLVLAGAAQQVTSRFALARYRSDGSLDTSFGTAGLVDTSFSGSDTYASSLAVRSDGRLVVTGSYGRSVGGEKFALAQYNRDGTLDSSFGSAGLVTTTYPGSDAFGATGALQPDGRLVVAGTTYTFSSTAYQFALARYNSDGSLDTSFGTAGLVTTSTGDPTESASAVAIQADGRIVVAGITGTSSNYGFALARYQGDAIVATWLDVSAPATATAGQPFDVTVTARDNNGNVATGYTGTVTLTSTDPAAALLGSHTFVAADAGVFTFSGVQLFTAGPQSLFASDGSLSSEADLMVLPGDAVALLLTGPNQTTAGMPFQVTVTAYDAWGNVATGYRGTVAFASSDPAGQLPDPYQFSSDDAGSHVFTLTLNTPGPVQLIASDTDTMWSSELDLTVT
jgi:uncharacterized delta-60 repeat protein